MVQMNFGTSRPAALLDLTKVPQLSVIDARSEHTVGIGSTVPLHRIIERLKDDLPGLAMAARTVGSPQIRYRATLGGNLMTASPAGDTLPPLMTSDAVVELASTRGHRTVRAEDFVTGPKRSVAQADELLVSVRVPRARGPQEFAKVGTRNAMVISVAGLALELDPRTRALRCAVGAVAPTVRRAARAEALAPELPWASMHGGVHLEEGLVHEFGRMVRVCATPIDDVRGTADYRLHAVEVLARRCLTWAWTDLQGRAECA